MSRTGNFMAAGDNSLLVIDGQQQLSVQTKLEQLS